MSFFHGNSSEIPEYRESRERRKSMRVNLTKGDGMNRSLFPGACLMMIPREILSFLGIFIEQNYKEDPLSSTIPMQYYT